MDKVSSQYHYLWVSRLVRFCPLQQLSISRRKLVADGSKIWTHGCLWMPVVTKQYLKVNREISGLQQLCAAFLRIVLRGVGTLATCVHKVMHVVRMCRPPPTETWTTATMLYTSMGGSTEGSPGFLRAPLSFRIQR